MKFTFINELSESALIRHQSYLEKYDARDLSEFIFLYCISLQILVHEPSTKEEAIQYVTKTLSWGDVDSFRNYANDLYIMTHTLFGKFNTAAFNRMKNYKENTALSEKFFFRFNDFRVWLRELTRDSFDTPNHRQFMLRLEAMLNIKVTNYMSIRRLTSDWKTLSHYEKQLVMTRLLLAFRTRINRSELLPLLEKVSRELKLEIKDVENPELDESITPISEDAAMGSVCAGAIAAIPTSINAEPIRRITKKKRQKINSDKTSTT